MKPLKISHSAVTSKALLRMADSIPGAWIGIRIAGLLLLLSGWKSTTVSRLFGLSRQAVVTGLAKPIGRDSTAFTMWRVRAGRHDWTAWLRTSWRRRLRNRQKSSACNE